MKHETKILLKLLSVCLAFPDPALMEALPEMESVAKRLGNVQVRGQLADFLSALKAQPLLGLQEHYTAVFELNPSASLNLTYHLMGDREDRGPALAELMELYRQAGFEPAVADLPDFLPLVLEFLATTPQAGNQALIQRCLSALATIGECLRKSGSLYTAPLEMVSALVSETRSDPP
jgi:nitrate reductase molybdenum cofactor assembly chaperone NarJ/NarW